MSDQALKKWREASRIRRTSELLRLALAELQRPTNDYNRTELARVIAAHLEG